mgnify:CR=1 FL=1
MMGCVLFPYYILDKEKGDAICKCCGERIVRDCIQTEHYADIYIELSDGKGGRFLHSSPLCIRCAKIVDHTDELEEIIRADDEVIKNRCALDGEIFVSFIEGKTVIRKAGYCLCGFAIVR